MIFCISYSSHFYEIGVFFMSWITLYFVYPKLYQRDPLIYNGFEFFKKSLQGGLWNVLVRMWGSRGFQIGEFFIKRGCQTLRFISNSVIDGHIFVPLNQYGHPNIKPKFFSVCKKTLEKVNLEANLDTLNSKTFEEHNEYTYQCPPKNNTE